MKKFFLLLLFIPLVSFGQDYSVNKEKDLKTSKAYFDSGSKKHENGDYYGAIEDYTKSIEIMKSYSDVSALSTTAKKAAALDLLNGALDFGSLQGAYYSRGNSKRDLKDYDGAIADYTKAIDLDPNFASAYNNRANSKVRLKNYIGAIFDYNKAIDLDPNFASAYNNRGIANFLIGGKKSACEDGRKAQSLGYNASAIINAACN